MSAIAQSADSDVLTLNQILGSVTTGNAATTRRTSPGARSRAAGTTLRPRQRHAHLRWQRHHAGQEPPRSSPASSGPEQHHRVDLTTFLEGRQPVGTNVHVSSTTYLTEVIRCPASPRRGPRPAASPPCPTAPPTSPSPRRPVLSRRGSYVAQRFNQENVFEGNTLSGSVNERLRQRESVGPLHILGQRDHRVRPACPRSRSTSTNPGASGLPSGVLMVTFGYTLSSRAAGSGARQPRHPERRQRRARTW